MTTGCLVALGGISTRLHRGFRYAAPAATKLDTFLNPQETPNLLELLVIEVVLHPVWPAIERSLHFAGQKFFPLELQGCAALFIQRLGGGAKPKHYS